MTGQIRQLYVYPIKGLSAQPLESVTLEAGRGVPHDRELALARPEGRYVPGQTSPLPKDQFFMLARDARLAGLTTTFDPGTSVLRVAVRGHEVLEADVSSADGAAEVTAFFARVLDRPAGSAPLLASAAGRRFTDVSVVSDAMMNAISLINLDSVRDLEDRIGVPVDPLRFRANVYFEGLPPFSELDLVGQELRIGDLRLRAVLNTKRCAATEVDPIAAVRDIPVPRHLVDQYGHAELGFYAEVVNGGTIRPGDVISYGDAS
ncbi:MOSC domain-containing protein [Prauserella cavernicola]|uniref:MOSC domain-containing protein n=1 Tax=Prauserella cavernicola TaxID=2800127 RepID=A0A934QZV4_9PSEU|nr:MOSC domain-containing protein [Prauserella cavernicola]MBK1788303.1 MOSC domain-containing protein [Prauserella cavernicola]